MSSQTQTVHVDCDPGIDDAIALMLLCAHPSKAQIAGITTVGGNVSIEKVTQNALDVCALVGRSDIPVFQGCAHPMILGSHDDEEAIHGESGLGGVVLKASPVPKQIQHGVWALIEKLQSIVEPIRILALGPLTNLAMALVLSPSIKEKIADIVFMGGAMGQGNVPGGYAEFNIFTDPHAAHVVLNSGIALTMIGLDVTNKAQVTPQLLEAWRASSQPALCHTAEMLSACYPVERQRYGFEGALVHDACAAAFVLHPEWFSTKFCPVSVEIASSQTRGQTVVDWYNWTKKPCNVHVVYDVNTPAFLSFLEESLASYCRA